MIWWWFYVTDESAHGQRRILRAAESRSVAEGQMVRISCLFCFPSCRGVCSIRALSGKAAVGTCCTGGTQPRINVAKKDDVLQLEGVVTKVLPATMYRVKLTNDLEVLAHISGKMRKHFIRITAGDRVSVELSPYDLTKGRITYRHRA